MPKGVWVKGTKVRGINRKRGHRTRIGREWRERRPDGSVKRCAYIYRAGKKRKVYYMDREWWVTGSWRKQ